MTLQLHQMVLLLARQAFNMTQYQRSTLSLINERVELNRISGCQVCTYKWPVDVTSQLMQIPRARHASCSGFTIKPDGDIRFCQLL